MSVLLLDGNSIDFSPISTEFHAKQRSSRYLTQALNRRTNHFFYLIFIYFYFQTFTFKSYF